VRARGPGIYRSAGNDRNSGQNFVVSWWGCIVSNRKNARKECTESLRGAMRISGEGRGCEVEVRSRRWSDVRERRQCSGAGRLKDTLLAVRDRNRGAGNSARGDLRCQPPWRLFREKRSPRKPAARRSDCIGTRALPLTDRPRGRSRAFEFMCGSRFAARLASSVFRPLVGATDGEASRVVLAAMDM
jgi:hypothetical protein